MVKLGSVPKSSNRSKRQHKVSSNEQFVKECLEDVRRFLNDGSFILEDGYYVFRLSNARSVKITKNAKRLDEDYTRKAFIIDTLAQQVLSKGKGQNFIKDLEALGTHERYVYYEKGISHKSQNSLAIYNALTTQLTHYDRELKTFQNLSTSELETVLLMLVAISKEKDHAKKFLRISEYIQKTLSPIISRSALKEKMIIFLEGDELIIEDEKAIYFISQLYKNKCFYPSKGMSFKLLTQDHSSGAIDISNFFKKAKSSKDQEKKLNEVLSKIICKGFKDDKYYLSRGVVVSLVQ